MTTDVLPVRRIADVEEQQSVPWLVEQLWTQQGVGFLCGSPKSCKTWLALDLALSVASRTPALGRYEVSEAGTVLLFAAEDAPTMVRSRLAGIARRQADVHRREPLPRGVLRARVPARAPDQSESRHPRRPPRTQVQRQRVGGRPCPAGQR